MNQYKVIYRDLIENSCNCDNCRTCQFCHTVDVITSFEIKRIYKKPRESEVSECFVCSEECANMYILSKL